MGGKCRRDGCERPARIQGFCVSCYQSHYERAKSPVRNGPAPGLTVEQVAQAKRMRAAFKTLRQIADEFGCSVDTVRRALRPGYGKKSATRGGAA